ncbi:MAG: AraC family transcriptional regulator [Pseudomonadales bacterium]|nr:AraC family transcriptional regulator [Pseudomonadales bacterium]
MSLDSQAFVSIDYLEPILKHCNNCGISNEVALAGTSLLEQVESTDRDFIMLDESEQLLANLEEHLPISPYQTGLLIGVGLSVSSLGQLGFIGLCSKNFDEALSVTSRFIPIVSPLFAIDYELEDDLAVITISDVQDIPEKSHAFILGLFLGGIRAMSLTLLGTRLFNYLDRSTIQLTLPESSVDPVWREAMGPLNFEYGCKVNRISFAKELVMVDLPFSNKASLASALAVCEERMALLEKKKAKINNPVTQRVIQYLESTMRPYPSLEGVAEQFCVSPRTLHRQLQKEQTSYSKVLTHWKIEKAKQLLKDNAISIKEVAYELDYSDVSNFSAAFKKATEITPSQFRSENP